MGQKTTCNFVQLINTYSNLQIHGGRLGRGSHVYFDNNAKHSVNVVQIILSNFAKS